jgi:hypothetical protein
MTQDLINMIHKMQIKVTQHDVKLNDLKLNCTKMMSDVELVETQLKNKVAWSSAMWFIGLVITISGSLIGMLWVEIRDMQKIIYETRNSVARIEGYFNK